MQNENERNMQYVIYIYIERAGGEGGDVKVLIFNLIFLFINFFKNIP